MGQLLKRFPLFLMLLFVASFGLQQQKLNSVVEASRPLPFVNQQRYSNIFDSLGVVCKCCDYAAAMGESEEHCTTSWAGSCSNLRCLPWKLH
ncbi:hypothetical protein ACH5RR_004912 [Cinchona calisaya]|uniref:Uncharacterized protein n=1 Tax=Cinchona calisaya TaxID=153742 RepID=A0ABD3AZC8_9GENT